MPNADEIKEKGLKLGDFQMRLLEKIEELTLYTVQHAKTVQEQQRTITTQQITIQDHKTALDWKDAEIAALKSQNAALDARLAAVEEILERLSWQKNREQK